MTNWRALCAIAVMFLGACHAPRGWATAEGEPSAEAARTVASLDDVTNGLAGAFFDDGDAGDVRARSENRFVDTTGDGLPDARVAAPRRDRMLVYTGQVFVEVARPDEAAAELLGQVEQWGGYLQRQDGNALTVRLPAERFEEAFAAVRAMGRVLKEQRQASDVTEEFVDLGIRLDNAKQARDRLLEVLKMAEKVEDILKVEAELRRLTEEIERMEGRLKFLRDQVALATLRAEFRATSVPPPSQRRPKVSRFPWINRVGANAVMEHF